ncbi:hypothetical protein GCM10007304_05970 [Rhodococcoides trifolii]|uniref:Uncharacterized protein n=1 Tax=Rhodococcoides trifolii TaxID=908250 RepID=A0A917FN20_9NOCA|nr:DUF6764 family protein [Rhodococcus trifolii]GGF94915.1 hypothetical protein GCM10007304_05970 [Rhodococcus trifolii]
MPTRFLSSISRKTIRLASMVTISVGLVVGGAALGSGVASAAPVTCSSPPSANDIRVNGVASCGAQATGVGVANATASESGTAVSVADAGGQSTAYATGFGTALSSVIGQGTAYAISIGGGITQSQAVDGNTTVAIAGFGGGATAVAAGVNCEGVNSFAFNARTGMACIAGS